MNVGKAVGNPGVTGVFVTVDVIIMVGVIVGSDFKIMVMIPAK